jgi:hypothetical protein
MRVQEKESEQHSFIALSTRQLASNPRAFLGYKLPSRREAKNIHKVPLIGCVVLPQTLAILRTRMRFGKLSSDSSPAIQNSIHQ